MMERRFVVAVTLMLAVLVVPSFFLKRPPRRPVTADSTQVQPALPGVADSSRPLAAPQAAPSMSAAPAPAAAPASQSFDTVWINDPGTNHPSSFRISTAGATIDRAQFP